MEFAYGCNVEFIKENTLRKGFREIFFFFPNHELMKAVVKLILQRFSDKKIPY